MKISKRQQEEIDFLVGVYFRENPNEKDRGYEPTRQEREDYINTTVLGRNKVSLWGATTGNLPQDNKLFIAKRKLDIDIKSWRRDLLGGLLLIDELREDFDKYPYGLKLCNSILRGIDFDRYESGQGFATIVMLNLIRQEELHKNV